MPINNNPLSYKGRINRFSFAITVFGFVCLAIFGDALSILGDQERALGIIGVLVFVGSTVLIFFATIKRLRDLKRSPWWSLLILLGIVYLIMYLCLISFPSKWPEYSPIEEENWIGPY